MRIILKSRFNCIFLTLFAEPVLPKTTTSRPFRGWFPPASPRPGDWPSIGEHLSGLSPNQNETVISNSTSRPILTTLDPEDYEDESIDDSDHIPGT